MTYYKKRVYYENETIDEEKCETCIYNFFASYNDISMFHMGETCLVYLGVYQIKL